MFANCCGCSKNEEKMKNSNCNNETKAQSDNNVIANVDNFQCVNSESERKLEKIESNQSDCKNNAQPEVDSLISDKINKSVVLVQPTTTSVSSEIKVDEYDEDDDVFCEGVGSPVKLAQNLGTPYPSKKEDSSVPLPTWFLNEDNDQEVGGIQEPPATPVGRDELALRRHRFFSELLSAAQNVTTHKVRFNPWGPSIAGVTDNECCPNSSSELEALVSRLENVTVRLENICLPVQEFLKTSSNCSSNSPTPRLPTPNIEEQPPAVNMSVMGFQDILQGPLAQYLAVSAQIGGDVAEHSKVVNQAFQAQLQYLVIASQSKAPNQSQQMSLLQPTSQHISAIQDFREKHRTSQFFNHLSAISESIPALGWVTVSPAPAPYVKEMNDAGQFYTNRVLKDWKEKDKKHVDWVKAWVQTLSDLQAFVKQYHTTGLVWAGKNAPVTSGIPPPPPAGCPPPPPLLEADFAPEIDPNSDRSALFAQINQGENITRSLKKVTSDMQTHKNPTLRTGPAPFKATHSSDQLKPNAPIDKPPVFVKEGKKWLIEYQKGNHNLVVDNVEMNNVVYLFRCVDTTVNVKGKLNSITLDSCKKTSIVFETLVSAVEFINCQSVQMQVFGKIPTISIDKTDGCQMYLSPNSLEVEIISSKSSEMNVLVPKGNGDYTEYPIPEQYKTTINPGKGLKTIVVENKG